MLKGQLHWDDKSDVDMHKSILTKPYTAIVNYVISKV